MKPFLLVPIVVSFCAAQAIAAPPVPAIAQILDICHATTIAEATAKGDALGWARMTDADTKSWREGFVRHNGGTVEQIGWKRGPAEGDDTLSYWIATGPNRHKACTYTPSNQGALVRALTDRLGPPVSTDSNQYGMMVQWYEGRHEIVYSRFGTAGNMVSVDKGR